MSQVEGLPDHETAEKLQRLCIAVLTFHRPDQLRVTVAELLKQLESIKFDLSQHIETEILVVDNAHEPEVPTIVELAPTILRYVHEPRPGISAARNRALQESVNSDLLIFVDDDIVPQRDWLKNMLELRFTYQCEGVLGHVTSTFDPAPEPWIFAGGFFDRPEHPTGSLLPAAASNNLLLDLAFIRKFKIEFNESLGLIGGEDSLFTRQMVAHGAEIRWCNEAKSFDPVPAHRATHRWVSRRAFRVGNSEALVALHMKKARAKALVRLSYLCGGTVRVAVGSFRRALGKLRSNITLEARGARTAYRGAGHVMGALNLAYYEYERGRPQIKPVNLK